MNQSLYFSVITQDSLVQACVFDADLLSPTSTFVSEPGAIHLLQHPTADSVDEIITASRAGEHLLLAYRAEQTKPVLTLEKFFTNGGQLQILSQDGQISRGIAAQDHPYQGPLNFSTAPLGGIEEQAQAPAIAALHQAMFSAERANVSNLEQDGTPRIVYAVDRAGEIISDLSSGGVTDDRFASLVGTGAAGSLLEIIDGGAVIGEVMVGPDGRWAFEQEEALIEGGHNLSVRVKGATETSEIFVLVVDSVAPFRAVIEGVYDDREGLAKIGRGEMAADNTPLFTGSAEALSLVSLYNGQTLIGVVRANGAGVWSYTPPFGLPDGDYSITAIASDYSGNIGLASQAYRFTIDTVPVPAATVRVTSISDDTGASSNDFITQDATLIFNLELNGEFRYGERVQISFDNGASWSDAAPLGRGWIFDNTEYPFVEGEHDVLMRVVNSKGVAGTVTSQHIVVDMTAPTGHDYHVAIDSFVDDAGNVTGAFGSGTVTDDTSPMLKGTVAGLQFGDEVHIYEAGNYIGTAIVNAGSWSFQLAGLSANTHSYQAIVVDRAGNLGETSNIFNIVVDLSPPTGVPSITQAYDDVGSSQGWLRSGSTTDDKQPTLHGVAEPNGLVNIYLNGAHVGQVQADSAGAWSFESRTLEIGQNTFTAKNISAAGIESAASSAFTLRVESTTSGSGAMAFGGLGYEVTNAGDFNGDGIDDFIVTAPANQYGAERKQKSAAYIVYGTATGLPSFEQGIDKISASQGIKIDASQLTTGDYRNTGIHARGAGDFNGDGYDDIIIGSHFEDGAHIIFGRGDAPASIQLKTNYDARTSTDVTRIGWGSAWSGADMAWSDVNGDGYADAIISDSKSNKVYVLYGGENAKDQHGGQNIYMNGDRLLYNNRTELAQGSYSTINSGTIDRETSFGDHLNSVGDVNGDGFEDFIVTYPRAYNAEGTRYAGSAFLLFGQQQGFDKSWSINDYAKRGIRLNGSERGELLGDVILDYTAEGHGGHRYGTMNTVSTLGDINGDGIADFIIGSPDWGDGVYDGNAPGRAYVVFGKKGDTRNWSDINLGELNGQDGFILQAKGMGNAQLGNGVMGGGDFNGDGIDDFLVGAPNATVDGKANAGATYLVFGQKNGAFDPVADLDELVSQGKAIKWSGNTGDRMGTNHAMGDWNGDGIMDVAIPSWMADPNGLTNSGSYSIQYGETVQLTHKSTSGDDIIIGSTSSIDRIAGGLGNDVITNIGIGDVVYGGAGDDRISLDAEALKRIDVDGKAGVDTATFFTRIDGGQGVDTLVLTGSDKVLNIGEMGERLRNIEKFDLGTSNNILQITQGDVVRLGKIGLVTGTDKVQLQVIGSGETSVELLKQNSSQEWIKSNSYADENGKVYDVYTDSRNTLELFVPQSSAIIATGFSSAGFQELQPASVDNGSLWMLMDNGSANGLLLADKSLSTVYGGQGDDVIGIRDTSFSQIKGGAGIDTLLLDGANLVLEIDTLVNRITGIEKIQLGHDSYNSMSLSADSLNQLGKTSMMQADGRNQLVVNGDASSAILLKDTLSENWTEAGQTKIEGVTYHSYLAGANELLIEQNIQVTVL